jgi:putative membrane protein
MMWGYGVTYSWGGMFLMILSMLFWFALLGALIWALVRWVTNTSVSSGTPGSPSALEILQQRYARGEIDAATFERMRQQLLGSASSRDSSLPSAS